MRTFAIEDDFYLDKKPFKVISGAIHYFRVVPEYWQDRLEKLRLMGCNTVKPMFRGISMKHRKASINLRGSLICGDLSKRHKK